MKAKSKVVLVVVIGLVISGCGQEQVSEATTTPIPTFLPTDAAIPINTSTPIPVSLAYQPVPRWMILAQPFMNVEILGEKWNYTDDRWGDAYACISYSREQDTYTWFEQCFTLIYSKEVSFESQHDQFLTAGYEELTPQNTFGDTGQIALLGMRLENNVIEFFEIIGIGDYVTLVELDIEMDDDSSLQSIYEEQVADIMDYVL